MCARNCAYFSGIEGTTFFLPGGFIAIAVGDGEKLMEHSFQFTLFSPLKPLKEALKRPHNKLQHTIFSAFPNIKDFGGNNIRVGSLFVAIFCRWKNLLFSPPKKKSMNFSLLSRE